MKKSFFHRYLSAGCMALAVTLTLTGCDALFDDAKDKDFDMLVVPKTSSPTKAFGRARTCSTNTPWPGTAI